MIINVLFLSSFHRAYIVCACVRVYARFTIIYRILNIFPSHLGAVSVLPLYL